MTEYRIAEEHKRFYIEVRHDGKEWHDLKIPNVPRYFDTLADARSWVATIKRGVVYHDAEDAPNLAQDERKAEDDTSDGIKPLEWFEERIGRDVMRFGGDGYGFKKLVPILNRDVAISCVEHQKRFGWQYSDPR
jgi:hypothetical protein